MRPPLCQPSTGFTYQLKKGEVLVQDESKVAAGADQAKTNAARVLDPQPHELRPPSSWISTPPMIRLSPIQVATRISSPTAKWMTTSERKGER